MASLLYYKFNNYYNRKLTKGHDKTTINDFIDAYGEPLYLENADHLNFNPRDGVNTTVIAGRETNRYIDGCDYVIYSDDNDNITSKWFVLDENFNRNGQKILTLLRNAVAEAWTDIIASPAYIEKAILPPTNPLIYNKEDIAVNQIKTSETLLKDEYGCGWIVGYVGRDYAPTDTVKFEAVAIPDYTETTKESWIYYPYINTNIKKPTNSTYTIYYVTGSGAYAVWGKFVLDSNNTWTKTQTYARTPGYNSIRITSERDIDRTLNWLNSNVHYSNLTPFNNYTTEYGTTRYNFIYNNANKIIEFTTDGDMCKINKTTNNVNQIDNGSITSGGVNWLTNKLQSCPYISNIPDAYYAVNYTYDVLQFNLAPVANGSYKMSFPTKVNRYHCKDNVFDIFAIPYDDIQVQSTGNVAFSPITINKSIAASIAQGIAETLGSNLYDLQIVPYSPFTGFEKTNNVLDIKANNAKRFTIVQTDIASPTNVGVIIWATASQGSKSLPFTAIGIQNKKIENQCDIYRLVSPNWNGQFEFNAAKNGGISGINVDYTLMPYQPYFHIYPLFDELYGSNFCDARGLICGGDFSLSYLNDKWQEYLVNNKNYLNIFDRQIENMEVQNKYAKIGDITNAFTGTIQSAASSAALGGIAGGIAGGLASLGAGIADIGINEALRNETLDYTKDMFNYNLDNIKAMPDSIAKNTAYTNNNKIFPVLEYYTCTDTEKTAIANKIAYNGMTVMAIGKIEDYINNSWSYGDIISQNYIKAKIIKLESDKVDDFHMANSIAKEINMGLYYE